MNVDILYGSATGNAEYIAKDLAALINNNDKNNDDDNGNNHPRPFTSAACMEMNHFKRKKLFETWSAGPPSPSSSPTKHAVIVICSTTGNGDAPENASRFVRFLKKPPPSSSPLRHVAFAVLGLGDTNYDRFCEAGKLIDRKLAEWGGTRAVALACADEATGLEATVEPWLEGVLEGLAAACVADEKGGRVEGHEKGGESEKEGERGATDATSLSEDLQRSLAVSAAPSVSLEDTLQCTKPLVSHTSAIDPENTSPSSASATPAAIQSPTPLFILYGSATGNAEHMAKDLAASYRNIIASRDDSNFAYFPSVTVCPLNDYKKTCLEVWSAPPSPPAAKHGLLFLCSTTGNADAPENADRFVRWLKRKSTESTQPFQHCAYAVLGLGDSNYDVFCAMGKLIDRKVGELGGTRAVALACADEATGLEEVVEPWVAGVVDDLARVCSGVKECGAVRESAGPSRLAKEESTASVSASEEKKMEDDPPLLRVSPAATPTPTSSSSSFASSCSTTTSVGVATIRKHLRLTPQDPLPSISNSCLPAMTSNLSSCEFVRDDEDADADGATDQNRPRLNSVADNMTETSGSSGFHFTLTKPYESKILNARYLTKGTGVECARRVCELMKKTAMSDEMKNDDASSDVAAFREKAMAERDRVLMEAMKLYDQHFPLAPSDGNDANGTNNDEQQRLQYSKNGKRVIEMTLALPDDFTLEYEPGDSVGLIVSNAPHAANFVLDMLRAHHGITPTQKIVLDATDSRSCPVTVGDAVRNKMDLCSPMKKKRLFLLSQYATDPEERQALRLLSANSTGVEEESGISVDLFQTYVEDQHRSIVDILKEFPSCQSIPLEGLFGILPAIPPRYYSVCSSPLSDREVIDGHSFHLKVAFSVVDYLTPSSPNDPNSHRRMGGVATRYLECACSPFLCNDNTTTTTTATLMTPTIQIFPKPTHDFRLPANLSTPLVLIGPGTGIAPFLGFLSHRQAQIASLESKQAAEVASEGTWRGGYELDPEELNISDAEARGLNLAVDYMRKQRHGEIDLFFGCRYSDHDWLYETEVEEFRRKGIVSRSYNAFSRDEGREKMYVQTIMQKDDACGSRLVDMITERMASVYICGDGNAMGRDVQEAITKLLAEKNFGKELSETEAVKKAVGYIDQMKRSGRFVLDIWS